jgi:hypothetical protein
VGVVDSPSLPGIKLCKCLLFSGVQWLIKIEKSEIRVRVKIKVQFVLRPLGCQDVSILPLP